MNCEKCGSNNICEESEVAEICCDDCGFAWKDENKKDIVEFLELDNGRKTRIGSDIRYNVNRDLTIKKARNRIEGISSKVGLPQSISDHAVNVYKSALNHHLTQSVPADIMAGACLYLSSRLNNKPIFMLEISDKIGVNIYTLGKVYKNLKDKLGQCFYDIDPCLFIERFAHSLDLGEKTSAVSYTALKILCRMKKDWISTGRRPTGLTAIALLIACLIHRFDRNFGDVSRLAGVSKQTVKKRMKEFFNTASAKLSLTEFSTIDLDDETNPPAYQQNIESHMIEADLNDSEYNNIECEIRNIMNVLTETEENAQYSDYTKLIQSVKNEELDTQSLINMVTNEDEDSDNNEELNERAALLSQCIDSSRLNEAFSILSKQEDNLLKNDGETCSTSNCTGGYLKDKDIGLPFKIPIVSDETEYPDITTLDDPQLTQFDEDELNSLICTEGESIKKLKWFFGQRENRNYFRQKKEREKLKAEKLKVFKEKNRSKRSATKRSVINAVELVAEFDKEVELAKRSRLDTYNKSERSLEDNHEMRNVTEELSDNDDLIVEDLDQNVASSSLKHEAYDEYLKEYDDDDEDDEVTSVQNITDHFDEYENQFSDYEEF